MLSNIEVLMRNIRTCNVAVYGFELSPEAESFLDDYINNIAEGIVSFEYWNAFWPNGLAQFDITNQGSFNNFIRDARNDVLISEYIQDMYSSFLKKMFIRLRLEIGYDSDEIVVIPLNVIYDVAARLPMPCGWWPFCDMI